MHRESDKVTVTVTEGRVTVADGDPTPEPATANVRKDLLLLGLGQRATLPLHPAASISPVSASTAGHEWENGRADFINSPLSEVLPIVNRYASTRLVIDDPRVADLTYSGTIFRNHIDEWSSRSHRCMPSARSHWMTVQTHWSAGIRRILNSSRSSTAVPLQRPAVSAMAKSPTLGRFIDLNRHLNTHEYIAVGTMAPENTGRVHACHAHCSESPENCEQGACLLIALVLGWCAIAFARADDVTERQIVFHIRAQPLASALIEFSKQTQLQIMSQGVDIAERKTSGIAGKYTVAEALKQLLAGSHLEYSATGPNTIAVTAATHTTSLLQVDESGSDREFLKVAQAGAVPAVAQAPRKPGAEANDARGGTQNETPEVKVETKRPFTDENVDIVRKVDDPQPYYIFDSQTIVESGATNAEDFLKQRLTMNTEAQTNAQSLTFRGNVSAINLRGIGATQTLILVNGRRMAAVGFNGSNYQPDINSVPTALIDRIEVLPASASADLWRCRGRGVLSI